MERSCYTPKASVRSLLVYKQTDSEHDSMVDRIVVNHFVGVENSEHSVKAFLEEFDNFHLM